ncbi:cyclic AMP-dependent transcription factor ATF-4 isoform X2 [Cololabis saira]|uniref:cyclic AMP-dependent transcription factor ATF-4 isoform X2 n=1 Tax=Cololabis saira TaxID=129043 RepID=UPI002AD29834|nr:cyclic AMP-dependent transcription factor ATF-4 isoform X2 [Cololabis saira]
MALSQLALEDVAAPCLEPSFPMADPMGPLLDQDEEALSPSSSLEVKVPVSPSLSFSSSASSPSHYQTIAFPPFFSASPPPSPPTHSSSLLGTKDETDLLSFSLLDASDLLDTHVGANDGKDDAFEGMDWMSEKIDFSEIDLDSLIGSCSSVSPGSPEDLLASLDSHMRLDSFEMPNPTQHNSPDLTVTLPEIQSLPLETPLLESTESKKTELALVQDDDVKSEPPSPSPAPSSSSPTSPAYTLELGSEVDVLDVEKSTTTLSATIISDPSGIIQTINQIVHPIPTSTHIVVVLANEEESSPMSDKTATSSDSEGDSGIESVAGSPPRHPSPPPSSPTSGSSRTKPYCRPEPAAASSTSKAPRVKSVSGVPKVIEKKLKKMEQNKTAATRYRQKKRVEQDLLNTECEILEKKNNELAEKAESISREIQYLKDLMEEVRKHRRGKTNSVA